MLPRATHTRTIRDSTAGRASGRSFEIQRLIGRSLRSVTDLNALGEKTVWIDCEVIQADGEKMDAIAVTDIVMFLAILKKMLKMGELEGIPVRDLWQPLAWERPGKGSSSI